ncbi:bifunctional DNA-formamidopyrimidine glycosylase/DNA-(apurinic or apyrimidinic site) lyase [Conexibacter sp. SYSU D00693]|uniref:bifunctional DNA-formamidopyrimidine glycosylase/DNA-(apurinic or apyrimidinic site) lyase n=1 Tax=Conexibacter sp. SYSU D00693 TaxID=2812560 RepID=UPI00196B22CE|nr:bifunctional DNA-formamidopyrimidine glycosylase/DNA-(apurinic or apyrimidinic site) lyase [Conexibacter sp. SYSU D00693]
MPELPEVETIRRQVAPVVEGRCVERLDVLDPRWCLPLTPEELRDAVEDRRVLRLGRRGKYLVWELAGDVFLLLHLRMTGTLLVEPPADVPYQRVVWTLSDGGTLRFCDPRRFGTGELAVGIDALDAFFAQRLGLEPLDEGALTGAALRAMAKGRTAPIKAFLLDQRRIAGVGNIYADEALHRAGVHPLRPAGSLKAAQYDALARTVREVLEDGIDAGGATIDDFRHADGVMGAFQHRFLVHRRAGEGCPGCGAEIVKMVVGGRGTYVCETCQPRPRLRRATRPRPAGAARGDRSGRPAPSR